ncbi:transmembrane protein 19-like [Physella acuta]|uniref:transmembrane protein 19-like n=1 Tax=Physella acuta TaxID=109671 RepID=UPI0027DE61B6|nr:transmembrane protein 19-like [Physella acuta]
MILALLIAILLPALTILWFFIMLFSTKPDTEKPVTWRWAFSLIAPLAIAFYGLHKKSLNQSGAAAGLIIGFLLTISSIRFMMSLLAFFIFASKATKFKAAKKRIIESDFKEGGQRNWVQVLSNGGPAAMLAILYMFEVGSVDVPIDFAKRYSASWYAVGIMAALACSSGDTFASEIGTAVGNHDPFHLVTFKRVPRGTNGAVSFYGTLSSLVGGLIVGLAFYITELLIINAEALVVSPKQWPIVLYGGLAGLSGSVIDSLLGGTLQYSGKHRKLGFIVDNKSPDVEYIAGREILDNHSVNLISSLMTGLLLPHIAAKTWALL